MNRSKSMADVKKFSETSAAQRRCSEADAGISSLAFNLYNNITRLLVSKIMSLSGRSLQNDTSTITEVIPEIFEDCSDSDLLIPIDTRGQISEEVMRKAENELGETPVTRKKALEELKRLIKKSGRIYRTDDSFLLMFLRVKKFEAPRAFRLMGNFYEYKYKHHDIHPFDEDIVRLELSTKLYTVLPYRDSQRRAIFVVRLGNFNASMMPFDQIISMAAAIVAVLLDDPVNQITGVVCIIDFANASLRWFMHLGIRNTKFLIFLFLSALPIRLQAIHIVNENILFKLVYHIIMTFASKKMKERFHFHGRNMITLQRHFLPSMLPSEFGGTLDTEEIIPDVDTVLSGRVLK